jgi:glutamate-1-semialdehyde 2,1-aminomutase
MKALTASYQKSEELLARALATIPLGTQTFSKSKTQFPHGVSPYFIKRGRGSRVWDADNNEYIDFVNALAAITLGYNDPDVMDAVKEQLELGTIFSLPHELEIQVAEKIVEVVPCAEMVRFAKNGSDATSGAVRIARAYTKRDRVLVCGYHGWHDWYIGSTARHLGVPRAVRDLTHSFTYNNIASLHSLFARYPRQIAAVILEPMNVAEPLPGYLQAVKDLAHRHGALLIFDETITGFRFALGGAQELFGVTPDLATLGKGLANGYPLSAVVGRKDIMRIVEDIFFSSTFGGETLSLAAALATITKLQKLSVLEDIATKGNRLKLGVLERIEKFDMGSLLAVSGHPSWTFLTLRDIEPYSLWQIKTLFLQEIFARGILSIGTHVMSYAHSDKDVDTLLSAYDEIFPMLKDAVLNRKLESLLHCQPLEPLFKVR